MPRSMLRGSLSQVKFPAAGGAQCFWWPGNDRRACVVRVRERGIASAQEAASNTTLLCGKVLYLFLPGGDGPNPP